MCPRRPKSILETVLQYRKEYNSSRDVRQFSLFSLFSLFSAVLILCCIV